MKAKKESSQYRNEPQLKLIGDKIRKHRLAKGLTQTDLALACGIADWSQISRMERGVVNFSISYLLLVAQVLEIDAKELLP